MILLRMREREALDRKRRDFCTEISAIEILMNFSSAKISCKFSSGVTNERTTLQNAAVLACMPTYFLPRITRGFFGEIFTSSLEKSSTPQVFLTAI